MKKSLLAVALLSFVTGFAQTAEDYLKPLKFRNIGPYRGGRSVSASGVVGDPMTYYMYFGRVSLDFGRRWGTMEQYFGWLF